MGAAAEARVTTLGHVHEKPEYTTWVVWISEAARSDRHDLSSDVSRVARGPQHLHKDHDGDDSGQHASEPSTRAYR